MADVKLVLIPCSGHLWLAYPEVLLARLYPYAPLLSVETNSEFVIGAMLVQNEKMPVVDITVKQDEGQYDGLMRLAVIFTIKNLSYQHYAIKTYGEPIQVTVSEQQIHTLSEGEHPFIAQYCVIEGHEDKTVAILDLPKFEDDLKI